MTGELPIAVLVMICDEKSAGRIVVELDPFIRFNVQIDRQLDQLEERMRESLPQLTRRGMFSRRAAGRRASQSK